MLTPAERAGLRAYLQSLPENPAFRTPCLPAPAAGPNLCELAITEQQTPAEATAGEFDDQPAPAEGAAALAEALTGLKVLLDLARALPLTRAAAVLVERVGKTSRRLEIQLGKLRTA